MSMHAKRLREAKFKGWPHHWLNNPSSRTQQELKEACYWAVKRLAVLDVRLQRDTSRDILLFVIGWGLGCAFVLAQWYGVLT
jgi:hypothetical protein